MYLLSWSFWVWAEKGRARVGPPGCQPTVRSGPAISHLPGLEGSPEEPWGLGVGSSLPAWTPAPRRRGRRSRASWACAGRPSLPVTPQPGEGVTASHAAPEQEAFALISRCLLPQPLCPRVLWGGSMNPGRGQCPPLPGGAPAEAGSPCPRGAPSPLPCLLATSDQ